MPKSHQFRNTLGSSNVEEVHASVARNTSASQNATNWQVWTTFGGIYVEKLHAAVAPRREAHVQVRQNVFEKHGDFRPLLEDHIDQLDSRDRWMDT